MMPRPDLALLGIKHRRIPILSIDRDIYVDTRLILLKLESIFPEKPRLGAHASSHDKVALEHLLQMFTTDTGLFEAAVNLLPTKLPLLNKDAYYKDRAQFLNNGNSQTSLSPQSMASKRPDAEDKMARALDFLEHGLLADGRQWILGDGSAGPGLGDIQAIWPFSWLTYLKGALPAVTFNESRYPLMYAWIERFRKAVALAKSRVNEPRTLTGEEAARLVLAQPFQTTESELDEQDSTVIYENLKAGDMVTVWPTDTGSSHKDTGKLVALNRTEVVIEVSGENGSVRLHAPRHGFKVVKARTKEDAKL